MSWDYNKTLESARADYDQTEGFTVSDVTREIDFDNISRRHPRRICGGHLYVDVDNFNHLLRQGEDPTEMLRRLHIFAREASTVISNDFDGFKVHFQGPKVHALAYRPISDDALMAAKTTLIMLALKHVTTAFNDVLDLAPPTQWSVRGGGDHGVSLATRSGTGGDQEMLFLGSPANHAAKIFSGTSVRVTTDIAKLLPDEFDPYLSTPPSDDAVRIVTMPATQVEALAADYGWNWTLERTRSRLEEAAVSHPPDCVTVSNAARPIDKSSLAISKTKRVSGVSVFADVDGFTSYIDDLVRRDADMVEAVRAFHVLRSTMRDTAVIDFTALRIQYQGDRMQALCYQPIGDEAASVLRAVELAAALKTISEEVLPQVVASEAAKPLAIGLALGEVLVSRMGQQGDPDVVTIGPSVGQAAAIQQRLPGGAIGLSADTHAALPDWLQSAFKWDPSALAWVSDALTHERFTDLKVSESDAPGLAAATGALGTTAVGPAAQLMREDGVPRQGLRPWYQE